MIHTLTVIQILFPFLLLLVFFCLYKKEYRFMKAFMWKMVMLPSASKLYANLVVLLLILINWCCSVTNPNAAVLLSSAIAMLMLNRRIVTSTLHLLNERKRLWFATLLVSLVSYAIPYMNSIFLLLFILCMASVFYPSEKVFRMMTAETDGGKTKEHFALIIKNYY
jgi:hypothetical protein